MSYFISNRTRVSLQFNYYWSRNCSSSVYVSSFGWTVALKHELWCASYKLSIFLEVQFSFLRSILAIGKCRCIVVSKEVHFCRVRLTPLCHPLFISFHFVHVDGSVSCFLTVHSCVQEVTQLASGAPLSEDSSAAAAVHPVNRMLPISFIWTVRCVLAKMLFSALLPISFADASWLEVKHVRLGSGVCSHVC
jgi:hypothetical protein